MLERSVCIYGAVIAAGTVAAMTTCVLVLGAGGGREVSLEQLEPVGPLDLAGAADLSAVAARAAITVRCGAVLTSAQLIGDPAQKHELFRRFGACVVDMETAALARVCRSRSIPLSCIRAVSDETADGFLAPLRYDPKVGSLRKAAALLGAGGWTQRIRTWRTRSAAARRSLRSFLEVYLTGEIS